MELYKWREYECSISKAVNCKTANKSILSFEFSVRSHASCQDKVWGWGDEPMFASIGCWLVARLAAGDLAHDDSSIVLNRSRTSAQWYNSHLPMFHDLIEHISASN